MEGGGGRGVGCDGWHEMNEEEIDDEDDGGNLDRRGIW